MGEGLITVDHIDRNEIVINGEVFHEDLVVTPTRFTSWRRGKPMSLSINDFQNVIQERPAYLIVGIGIDDNLQLDDFTKDKLQGLGFEVYTAKTRTAVKKFNSMCSSKKTVGLFHLT